MKHDEILKWAKQENGYLEPHQDPDLWHRLKAAIDDWHEIASKEASANTGAELDGASHLVNIEPKLLSEAVNPARQGTITKLATWKWMVRRLNEALVKAEGEQHPQPSGAIQISNEVAGHERSHMVRNDFSSQAGWDLYRAVHQSLHNSQQPEEVQSSPPLEVLMPPVSDVGTTNLWSWAQNFKK